MAGQRHAFTRHLVPIVLLLVTAADAAPRRHVALTVVTLNTKAGGEPPWNVDEQIAAIAAERPDIVFLQEAAVQQFDRYRRGLNERLHTDAWHGALARHCRRGRAPACAEYTDEAVMVLTRLASDETEARLIWAPGDYWQARGIARLALRL